MAGQFLTGSTTFMRQHTPGVNSTGMYIISGIPQVYNIVGAAADAFKTFDSLSRDITIAVHHVDGARTAAADPDGTEVNKCIFSFDSDAQTNPFHVYPGMTMTLPVRAKGIRVQVEAGLVCNIIATLTGIKGPAYDKYPRLKGDGTLTPVP